VIDPADLKPLRDYCVDLEARHPAVRAEDSGTRERGLSLCMGPENRVSLLLVSQALRSVAQVVGPTASTLLAVVPNYCRMDGDGTMNVGLQQRKSAVSRRTSFCRKPSKIQSIPRHPR
jgi:hypothetical protein